MIIIYLCQRFELSLIRFKIFKNYFCNSISICKSNNLANSHGYWTNIYTMLPQYIPCTLLIWDDIGWKLVSNVAITHVLALCICTMWTKVAQCTVDCALQTRIYARNLHRSSQEPPIKILIFRRTLKSLCSLVDSSSQNEDFYWGFQELNMPNLWSLRINQEIT